MPRPIVGITGGALDAARQSAQTGLRAALHAAGAVPILLRPEEGASALARIRALVLPGGGDVEPHRYGAAVEAEVREPDPERDAFEIAAARAAVERGLPLLGICRGALVLAVALGGSIAQHVPAIDGAIAHEGEGCRHTVHVERGSLVARVCGADRVETNSSHHQAPLPGGRAEAVGWTEDGVVEAITGPGPFTLGVGWHPETSPGASGDRLLSSLVAAASG